MKERNPNQPIDYVSRLKQDQFKLQQKAFEDAKKLSEKFKQTPDDRIWVPKTDSSGNSHAEVRFLPNKNLDAISNYFFHYQHFFQLPNGRYFIENCPRSIGEPCPVCEHLSEIWKTEDQELHNITRGKWAKKEYFANVYVKNDATEPEHNGKVYLFKMPNEVYKTVLQKVNPPEKSGIIKANVFDPLNAPTFNIRISTEIKPINGKKTAVKKFGASTFSEKSEPIGDDATINKLMNMAYDLDELRKEKRYAIRSYAEIKAAYEKAIGGSAIANTPVSETTSPPEPKSVEEALKKDPNPPETEEIPEDDQTSSSGPEKVAEEAASEDINIDTDDLFND